VRTIWLAARAQGVGIFMLDPLVVSVLLTSAGFGNSTAISGE
jgi:hypothetical protein